MILCICQNPWNVTAQRVNLNVCKLTTEKEPLRRLVESQHGRQNVTKQSKGLQIYETTLLKWMGKKGDETSNK